MNKILSITGLILFLMYGITAAQEYSELWGVNGEKWVPGSPLTDFTKAGYREGKVPFPRWPVKANVKDFGAVGDGVADDTKAIRDAIEACPANGAVYIPAGTYKITDWLKIPNLKNIIIRGEDMYETVLWFPKDLHAIHPNPSKTNGGQPTTGYSWSGGFFWFVNAEEVGIENLTFKFPDIPHDPHFSMTGYNMVEMSGKNLWMRNIYGYNMDSGPFCKSCQHATITNIILDGYSGRVVEHGAGRWVGFHHGVTLNRGSLNLVENCKFPISGFHDLSMEWGAKQSVWTRCSGANIEIDHHQGNEGIEHNLFSDIDMGIGRGSMYVNPDGGENSFSQRNFQNVNNETYWNMRSSEPIPLLRLPTADKKNLIVGWANFGHDLPDIQDPNLPWYEKIRENDISPPNIYIAQVKYHLGVDNLPPEVMITRPLDKGEFPFNANVTVTAMADDRDGSVKNVELLVNGNSFGTLENAPFQWTLPNRGHGNYQIIAMARDDLGAVSVDTVSIIAGDPAGINGIGKSLIKPGVVPAGNSITVSFFQEKSGQAELILYSINGKIAATKKTVAVNGVNHFIWKALPALEEGIYVMLIKTGKSQQMVPFVY